MSGNVFVDTNILVYSRDMSEPEKQQRAMVWLSRLWQNRSGRLSYQVLQEYYVTVTQKLKPGLPIEKARTDVRSLLAWNPLSIDAPMLEGAWVIQDRYSISWWDALIVSAAQTADSEYLLTEDLQPEQTIGGVTVINPFTTEPAALDV